MKNGLLTFNAANVTTRLKKPHTRECPFVIQNAETWGKPWHFIEVFHGDRLGRRNGNACAWLIYRCVHCGATLMVNVADVGHGLPALLHHGRRS